MNVITVASRKGGSGKSTLTAHLAAYANKASRRCLVIDADPQGSLSLWHSLRKTGEPLLRQATRGVDNLIRAAKDAGLDWVFIDTPPQMSGIVDDAIRAATLVVIPARPSVFDLDAVKETVEYARERRKPYAIVINGAPPRCDANDAPITFAAREILDGLKAPVWSGQITQRPIRWRLPRAKVPASSIRSPRPQTRSPACSRLSNAPSRSSTVRRRLRTRCIAARLELSAVPAKGDWPSGQFRPPDAAAAAAAAAARRSGRTAPSRNRAARRPK
jgi:chromosome partitioning protein